MFAARVGFTCVKGGRHLEHAEVRLAAEGPVGDRGFCLVDPVRRRVLRTVENPTLLRTLSRCEGGVLSVRLPSGLAEGRPRPTGERLEVDYWGRTAAVEVVDGPWSAAYSEFLGFDAVLARPLQPGGVVYAGPVSLVTTSSLRFLARRAGAAVDAARFRSTLVLDTDGLPPHVEESWQGMEMSVGTARIEVLGVIPRCGVLDLDPVTGERGQPVLRTLAGYRRDLTFGVDARVTVPGTVQKGDRAELPSQL